MLALQLVFTHFTMIGSREQSTYSGNERFWPITGGSTLRSVKDCLELKPLTPKPIQPGQTSFKFEIGNGASHIGVCSAFLIDNGKLVALNTELNCISVHQAMTVDIPNIKCDSCTLKIKVAANHQITTIEYYDSCLDVSILGSRSKTNLPSEALAAPQPLSTATDNSIPPAGSSGSSPSLPPAGSSGATQVTSGYSCSPDGKSYLVNGYTMPMAQGTKCVQINGAISVGFA